MQIALAWLLQRSRSILLIPGTASLAHVRENLAVGRLNLPQDIVGELDRIAASAGAGAH
jgi:aryl-alcohol dehydrogenase-like predicted oxidoreductase